jgi:transposase
MRLAEAKQIIQQQKEELGELHAEVARLQGQLADATKRIEELERAAARQAGPFRRREKKKVPEEEKKRPGRDPGHRGACRSVPNEIDETVEVPLDACPKCGGPLMNCLPLEQYIEEIPPMRPRVTRLTTWEAECPSCGPVRSTHPLQTSTAQGAAGVHLGPRALSIAAMLNKHFGLTMRKTCRVLGKLFGLSITPGGLSQAICRVANKTEACYESLIDQIRHDAAVFADETSWWVGGPRWWLWTFTTPQTTVYRVDKSRGSQVVHEMLGEKFEGMLVSDCLSSYDPPQYRKHKCIAHHLRAISQARDRPDTKSMRYLDQWKLFFTAVQVLARCRDDFSAAEFAERREHLEGWCDRLLAEPMDQSGDAAVRNRLAKQRAHLVGCLYEPAAEPTNNRA